MHLLNIQQDPARRIAIKVVSEQFEWALGLYERLDSLRNIGVTSMVLDKLPAFDGYRRNTFHLNTAYSNVTDMGLMVPLILVWANGQIPNYPSIASDVGKATEQYLTGQGEDGYDFTFLFEMMDHDYKWSDYFTNPTAAVFTTISMHTDVTELLSQIYEQGFDHFERTLRMTFVHSLTDVQVTGGGIEYNVSLVRLDEFLEEQQQHHPTFSPRVVNPYKGGGFSCTC